MPPETLSRRPPTPFEADPVDPPQPATPPDGFLFEVAWEVCNQVGGIYQVIRSKAALMSEHWQGQYCLVGPYMPHKAQLEFEEVPPDGWVGRVADQLALRGINARLGDWLIPGRPRALLLDLDMPAYRLAEAKYRLWRDHHIETPENDRLIDAAVTFGEMVRELLDCADQLRASRGGFHAPERIVAHFHEWQAGVAIPFVRHSGIAASTVFTTHATLLGRYVASNEPAFYDRLPGLNHDEEAARYNIATPHKLERAAAHGAHVFTTVSQVTAEECGVLLGRAPDVITPNGLNITRYNVGHDFQTFHANFKEELHNFTIGHFFPSYSFDLDRTLYMFTSGRYEPRNKGFDVCLESMARLNAELKSADLDITVVFFIVTSRPVRSVHASALEKVGVLEHLRDVCDNMVKRAGDQLFRKAAAGERPSLDSLVEEYWQMRFRRTQAAFRSDRLPMVVTHILEDEHEDHVLSQIRELGLFNRPEDPVKVVYHPEFISPVSPLWGIEYDHFVRGCHLGLFPSAYEPWGYTPLECMALGTPAISSDLAGFGRYVHDTYDDHDSWGLTVLRRRGRGFHDAARDLAEDLLEYCKLSRRDRVNLRNEVERRSWDFDWTKLCVAYHEAHGLALARM